MAKNRTPELPRPSLRLEGRVALVTGGAGHLGRAMAEALCAAGAEVVLNGRNAAKLKKTAAELNALGGRASFITADLARPKRAAALIAQVARRHGRLDVLVNNAYSGDARSEWDDFVGTYVVSVAAAAALIKAALPLLKKAGRNNPGGASVVNIASMYGLVSPDPSIYGNSGLDNPPSYGPAKAALIQLTRYYACRLGADNIRVNAISPGPFPPEALMRKHPGFHRELKRKNPLGRIGRADELKGPLLFLAGDAASYVTGANLVVDGGWTAW